MGDEAACPINRPQGNSARHDKALTHAALAGKTTSPPPSNRPEMVDVALHLAAQQLGKLCTR